MTDPDEPAPARPVSERLALQALKYPVPPIANRLPYLLGGLTFVGILVLIATGLVMDQFYDPSPAGAHDSIVYLVGVVPLGRWIRGLHYWSATFVTMSSTAHLGYVFWRRSYQRPREVTWWAGVLLLLLIFALVFTGTVLRADQEGTEALAHAVEGARLAGTPGAVLTPDFTRSTSLISRLHSAHVSLLPILLLAVLGLHFWLIRHLGIHSTEPRTVPFARHLRRLTGLGLLAFAALGVAAAWLAPGIGYPGVAGTEVTKPFWPFLWIYAAENLVGIWGMVIAPVILFGFLVLVPALDRGADRRPRWLTAMALLLLTLWAGGIVYGFFAPQMAHIM